jgi:hypothetical protein
MGHVVHFAASWPRNVIALFFMLQWDWYGFDKNLVGTPYTELAFLHPEGSVGQVGHSSASGA